MGDVGDAEDERFLEGPGGDVAREAGVARWDAAVDEEKKHVSTGRMRERKWNTNGAISFAANLSLNTSTPPTHTTLAPSLV